MTKTQHSKCSPPDILNTKLLAHLHQIIVNQCPQHNLSIAMLRSQLYPYIKVEKATNDVEKMSFAVPDTNITVYVGIMLLKR